MKRNGKKDSQERFEANLFRAVRSLRWHLPETEQEVDACPVDEDDVELPSELCDPLAALEPRTRGRINNHGPSGCDESIVEELAQAARQGKGAISQEVAECMRRDREAAERAADTDND